jgi:hypothetical protein
MRKRNIQTAVTHYIRIFVFVVYFSFSYQLLSKNKQKILWCSEWLLFVYVSFSYQLLSKNKKKIFWCSEWQSLSTSEYLFLFLERSWYEKETYTNSSHSLHHNIFFVFRKELIWERDIYKQLTAVCKCLFLISAPF